VDARGDEGNLQRVFAFVVHLSVRWQIIPREDPKVLIKRPLPLVRSQVGRALGEGRPFSAKSFSYATVDVPLELHTWYRHFDS
jgi:hypothetical protein